MFVPNRQLARVKTLPRAGSPWALDSGGFIEITKFGEWRTTPQQYVQQIRRYRDEVLSRVLKCCQACKATWWFPNVPDTYLHHVRHVRPVRKLRPGPRLPRGRTGRTPLNGQFRHRPSVGKHHRQVGDDPDPGPLHDRDASGFIRESEARRGRR